MKKYLGLAVVVILVATGTFVIASKIRKPAGAGFVVYQVARWNGQEVRRIIRSYKANGEWAETITDSKTGAQTVNYGTKESGVVRVNGEKKENEFIGGWGAPLGAEQIRKDPSFVDESEILGYHVMRIHMEAATDGSKTDLYRAPALHGMILKIVSQNADGSVLTIEPEKIETKEPDFALPSYPVTRDSYNVRHQKK